MALLHQDLTAQVIGIFYDVYRELGCGYLESVCQAGMAIAPRQSGLAVLEFPRMILTNDRKALVPPAIAAPEE